MVNPLKNSRTSDDIDMNLGPLTKLDKKNKKASKRFDDNVIVIFPIYGQFGTIWKPAFGHIVCKTYIFSNNNLLTSKNCKQN